MRKIVDRVIAERLGGDCTGATLHHLPEGRGGSHWRRTTCAGGPSWRSSPPLCVERARTTPERLLTAPKRQPGGAHLRTMAGRTARRLPTQVWPRPRASSKERSNPHGKAAATRLGSTGAETIGTPSTATAQRRPAPAARTASPSPWFPSTGARAARQTSRQLRSSAGSPRRATSWRLRGMSRGLYELDAGRRLVRLPGCRPTVSTARLS